MNSLSNYFLLAARVIVGLLLFKHGFDKVGNIAGFNAGLAKMGLPLPDLIGVLVIFGEIGLGLLLVIGLFTRVAGFLVIVMFVLMWLKMSLPLGVFSAEHGVQGEDQLTYALFGLVFLAVGAGTYSADKYLAGKHASLDRVLGADRTTVAA